MPLLRWITGIAFLLALAGPATARDALTVLLFADPQVKSARDIDYYARDIVEPLRADGGMGADLGITLGDNVDDAAAL